MAKDILVKMCSLGGDKGRSTFGRREKQERNLVTAFFRPEGESIREGHNIEYFTLPTRSILNRVVSNRNLPFTWAINPYRGCEFAANTATRDTRTSSWR